MIFFLGDLYIGENAIIIEEGLRQYLDKEENLLVINLESVILENKKFEQRKDKSAIIYTPKEQFLSFLNLFKNAKFIFNLGNNHLHDFGDDGILETKRILQENNLLFFGFIGPDSDDSFIDIIKNSKRIRLIALSTSDIEVMSITSNSNFYVKDYKTFDTRNIKSTDEFDFIIILPHWGKEYIPYPKLEIINKSKEWIGNSVDFVIGTHPHIIQGALYDRVFFSLGNFYFSNFKKKNKLWHLWKAENRKSIMVGFDYEKNAIQKFGIHYCKNKISYSKNSLARFKKVCTLLDNHHYNNKLYYTFYEGEYYKYLKKKNSTINKLIAILVQISIRFYEKVT